LSTVLAGTPGRRWADRPLPALALVAAAGALQTLACVYTALWPLSLAAIVLLARCVAGAGPRRAAALGGVFGCAWLVAATWWLYISMHRYGDLPAPLAAAAVALLSALLSTYLALAMAWVARRQRGAPLRDATRFAAGWLAAELARGVLFTGFPWAASGYTQVDGPLALLAPWLGVYGIGAVLAWAGAALGYAWQAAGADHRGEGRRRSAAARSAPALLLALVVLAGPAAWTAWRGVPEFTQPGRTLRVALLQTNVAQDEKFAAERMPEALAWLAQALTDAQADLVITPETAVPLLPDQLAGMAPGYWAALQRHFGRPGGPAALIGLPLGSYEQGYTNSVVGLSAATAAGYRYDKTHLVPFGEFIPTGFHWFTELMNIPLGDFNRGPRQPPSFAVHGERVAPNICYEDLFGEELARRFADPAGAPTVLANVSNIGWFGDTIALPQHLNISRLRSLELQRPMLRATNTGATAVIDHHGVVTARLPFYRRGVLQAEVQGRNGLTPFARWAAAAGLWPLWALAAAGLLLPPGRRATGH
jgi:apolipoprotein N-acyltransferase